MIAEIEINPQREQECNHWQPVRTYRNLVSVASEPEESRTTGARKAVCSARSIRDSSFQAGSASLLYTRIPAYVVGTSAALCRRHKERQGFRSRSAESIVAPHLRSSAIPDDPSGTGKLRVPDEAQCASPEAIAATAAILRAADAVIAGPLSHCDENTPGLLPHLADLADGAYRALRPPRSVISHPGFGQLARRFHYIQVSHDEARSLGCGAIDIGVLAHRLRQLQGEGGEFAITNFSGYGLLWADGARWEIEPIALTTRDESLAATVFCAAWVVARRFKGASAPKALAAARSAAVRALAAGR